MRLVAAPNGSVNRVDRSLWLSLGFDIAWAGAPVAVAGYARSAVAGWVGPARLAQGARLGAMGRAFGRAAVGAEFGRQLAASAEAGATGRGRLPGAATTGALERERLPEAATGGPF